MKRTIFALGMLATIMAVLVLSFSTASDVPQTTTICVTTEGCFMGIPSEDLCREQYEHSGITVQAFYQTGVMTQSQWDAACAEVMCDVNGVCMAMSAITCTELGGTRDGTACTGLSPEDRPCLDGQTNCICVDQRITEADGYCCSGVIRPDPTCGTTQPGEPEPSTCGNGLLESYEVCDPTYTAYTRCEPVPGVVVTCTLDCRCNPYPGDITPGDDTCSPGDPDCGTPGCEEAPATPAASVIPYTDGTLAFTVNWGLPTDPTCTHAVTSWIVELKKEGDAWAGQGPTPFPGDTFTTDLTESVYTFAYDTTYILRVKANFEGGESRNSAEITFKVGAERCYVGTGADICLDETTRLHCTYDLLEPSVEESCDPNLCYPTWDGAECLPPVPCADCNEAYDSIGEARATKFVSVTLAGQTEQFRCEELQRPVTIPETSEIVSYCHYDYTISALKEYQSCTATNYCSDYRSENSCNENVCNVLGDCEWFTSGLVGICAADGENIRFQNCDDYTAENICLLAPGCVWYGDCRHVDEMTCRHYADEENCIGEGSNWAIHPVTNANTSYSKDPMGFGKCKWMGTYCMKDSDNDGAAEIDADFTDPVTSLEADLSRPFGATVNISYTVNEPVLMTYADYYAGACKELSQLTSAEKPTRQASGGMISFTDMEDGEYCLVYYSIDTQRNVEILKQAAFSVDNTALQIINYQRTYSPAGEGLYDVFLSWEVTLYATCSATLTGSGGVVNPELPPSGGTRFNMGNNGMRAVPDGHYTFEIECATVRGQRTNLTETFTLSSDGRIFDPRHLSPPTYSSQTIPSPYMSIRTRMDASCEYLNGGTWTAFNVKTAVSSENYWHRSPLPSSATGYYRYDVRCQFPLPDGMVQGTAAHAIIFAIDNTGPTLTITEADGTPAQSEYLLRPGTSLQIDVTCEDADIPGANQNWAAKGEQLYMREGEEWQSISQGAYTLTGERTVTFRCEDALGNIGAPRTIRVQERDISGPERPVFEVVP